MTSSLIVPAGGCGDAPPVGDSYVVPAHERAEPGSPAWLKLISASKIAAIVGWQFTMCSLPTMKG